VKKAVSAARTRTSTKTFADRAARGDVRVGYEPEVFPFAGGTPVILSGQLLGAVGVSGASDYNRDHQASQAAAASIR
jgi:uncharacterized protein GlcG (DUF336 family)